MPTTHATTRTLLAATLAAGLVTTSACGGGSKETAPTPKPKSALEVGQDLAARLTAGDLGDFPVKSGDPKADIEAVRAGMGGLRPQVKADDTIRQGAGATVNLDYTWPLSYPWTYRAKATLIHEDDTWKLVWKPEAIHPNLSDETRLERTSGDSHRGVITGSQGSVIVDNAPALMVGIDKAKVAGPEAEASARALAELVLIDADTYARRVAAGPEGKVVDAIAIHRNALPWGTLEKIKGAVQREMTLPVGRDAGFARSIVGTVTTATAEDAAASQGKVSEGDIVGRTGLQGRFDDQLRGGGASKVIVAPRGAAVGSTKVTRDNTVADFPQRDGQSIASTIDLQIQSYLEDSLTTASVPVAAAAVRVSDGAVLAAGQSPASKGRPDSTTGEFHPGLAGGAVSALALIRSGAKPSDKVTCDKSAGVGGVTIDRPSSVSSSGSMTVAQAIARGCAPAVAQQAGRVQPQTYAEAAASLGLTGTPDIGFEAKLGTVADTGAEGARAQALAGSDQVTASALGLATMAASVSGGKPLVPWVTESLRPGPTAQLTPDEAKALQDIMESGANGVSVSGIRGALEGDVDGRRIVVAYTKDTAYAVVVGDSKGSKVTPEQVLRQMQAGAARSQSTSSKKTSSSSDD
ncbi:hypothetical protein GCM10027418_27470 [Mariniluteicoccus endophyticus]